MDGKKKGTAKKVGKSAPKKTAQGDIIFALDIGTRTVVGILANKTPQGCQVLDMVTVVHENRSMADGQIEDIQSVSEDIKRVKKELENRRGITLQRACIAAAGRALKTLRASWEYKLLSDKLITPEALKATELDAVRRTCEKFMQDNDNASFYCVGHSVISRSLDGFKVQKPEGHRGERLTTDIIAAFLPAYVVESLCAAVDNAGLEVSHLTLEPIAAMSVIVPPELRLINIALCDIGAGTSDIAISRDGSIVAYGMATTAGDEITEAIMKELLVDFNTAENIKTSSEKETSYKNILLLDCKISREQVTKLIDPAVRDLAKVIAGEILTANAKPPQAVFLVGGGSKLENLAKYVAEELDIDVSRVISGRRELLRGVIAPDSMPLGAEHATPLGIAISSSDGDAYDFTTITVNGKKLRALDTNRLTVFELMNFAKIKPESMIAPAGKNITFTLSGQSVTVRGEHSTPAEITVNGELASLNSVVTKGDEVTITPAVKGADGTARLSDYFDMSTIHSCAVTLLGEKRRAGRFVTINGKETIGDRKIHDGDIIELLEIETLGKLTEKYGINESVLLNEKKMPVDTILKSGDVITLDNAPEVSETPAPVDIVSDKLSETVPKVGRKITINGIETEFPARSDGGAPIFLDVAAAFCDDPTELLSNSQNITINGRMAQLDEKIHDGDVIVIE